MPRPLKLLATLLFASLAFSSIAFAQQDDEERRRAFQLFKEAKYTEALPVFEKLAATHSDDAAVIETYGLLVLGQAASLKDPAARKQTRARGRELLVRAEKLGANSTLLKSMLESIPPDGGEG